jgi:hypothetical protein
MCTYNQIPLKSGTPKVNFCIKWNISKQVFQKITGRTKALLPEIAGKYMNTFNFLEETCWKENGNNGKN